MTKSFKSAKAEPQRAKKAKTAPASSLAKAGTKMASLIEMLNRPKGASLADIATATGWQNHSVRGAISGHLKKKLGLAVSSAKAADGVRHYRIAA